MYDLHGESIGSAYHKRITTRAVQITTSTQSSVIADFSKEDVVQRILDLTEGQGVDTAIEALGADITFQNAINVTKAGGTSS